MSKVQICNRALSTYLGVGRINNLNETSAAAEQCLLHYDDTLQSLIEAHWWNFSVGRQVLAEETNDRTTEWSYKYALPSEALTIRWVNDPQVARYMVEQNQNPDAPREVTADHIYCDVQFAVCEFSKLVTDTTQFPQYFSDALSAALAANMAMPLTEDIKRATNAMNQAETKLDRAMALDEQQGSPIGHQTLPLWLSERGIG